MKVAVSSGAFHRAIERGDLTQLEFLDLCAGALRCDGVALDARHFPRADDDYHAQVKKMAADRGLTVAALADASLFADEASMPAVFERAVAIGAPLVATTLRLETATPWSEQLALLGAATSLAKRANVTIAIRNAAGTYAATVRDCKRVSKEADSAWLRYGPEPLALDASNEPAALAANAVLVWVQRDEPSRELLDAFAEFRGHLVLDRAAGDATPQEIQNATHAWHAALAEKELDRT